MKFLLAAILVFVPANMISAEIPPKIFSGEESPKWTETQKNLSLAFVVLFHEALGVASAYGSRELKSGSPYFIHAVFYSTLGSVMSGDWQGGLILGTGYGLQGLYNEYYLAKSASVSDTRFYIESIVEYHIPWLAFALFFKYVRSKPEGAKSEGVTFNLSTRPQGVAAQIQYYY